MSRTSLFLDVKCLSVSGAGGLCCVNLIGCEQLHQLLIFGLHVVLAAGSLFDGAVLFDVLILNEVAPRFFRRSEVDQE